MLPYRTRRALFRLALVTLLTTASFLLLEAGLRLAARYNSGVRTLLYVSGASTQFDQAHNLEQLLNLTGLGFRPGAVVGGFALDSRGFRTHEYSVRKPPGSVRLAVLGDSFAFNALPWRRTWPVQLEDTLHARGIPAQVLSFCIAGTGPRFYARVFELEVRHLEPDLVIVGFFIGNDFTDDSVVALGPPQVAFWTQNSYVVRLVRNLLRLRRARYPIPRTSEAPPSRRPQPPGTPVIGYTPHPVDLGVAGYNAVEWERMGISLRSKRRRFAALFRETREMLRRLHHDTQAAGTRLLVVMIPDAYQVDDALRNRLLRRKRIPPSAVDLSFPQRQLAAFLEAEGIPYLDLLPAFRRHSGRQLYLPRNTHWNRAGSRLGGRRVANHLLASGLLPAAKQ